MKRWLPLSNKEFANKLAGVFSDYSDIEQRHWNNFAKTSIMKVKNLAGVETIQKSKKGGTTMADAKKKTQPKPIL
ncbi:hypothetical protein RsTz2092_13840 [Deferribacterales bacterium RsTz2092]|nr:hypothetical protein AGMMS49941_13330 [Deferribacterales bacterium]